jgi:hypothetical protein
MTSSCAISWRSPPNGSPQTSSVGVVVTYKLGDAAFREAVVGGELTLTCQLNGRLCLVLEDLRKTVRHWMLSEAV